MEQHPPCTIIPSPTEIERDSTLEVIDLGCKDSNVDVVRSAIEYYEKDPSNNIVAPLADARLQHCDNYTWPNYIVEMAASCFNPEILALILEKKHYRIRRENCITPIHFLVRDNLYKNQEMHIMKKMLKMLCDAGYGINDQGHYGRTVLHFVCGAPGENFDLAKTLIEAGANVNCSIKVNKIWPSTWPSTALRCCVWGYKPLLTHYLLDNGADLSINTSNLVEDLFDGIQFKGSWQLICLRILKTLIAYGLDVNQYLEPRHILDLVSEGAKIKQEDRRDMYEFLMQSGLRFTDSLLHATNWISHTNNPLSLQRICANKIRGCFGLKLNENLKILHKAELLPPRIKHFIMLNEFVKLGSS